MALDEGGATLVGHVLDARGGAVAGAVVRAVRNSDLLHESVAVETDGTGRFEFWRAPGPVSVAVEKTGYVAAHVSYVAPSSDLVIRLTPGSRVQGTVVAEENGAPLAGMDVRAVPANSWSSPLHPSATTDSHGAFDVQGLEPGQYSLVAEGPGWRGQAALPSNIDLEQTVSGVHVTVSRAARITGKVLVRSTGSPCRNGTVFLGSVPSDADPSRPPSALGPSVPTLVAAIEQDGQVAFHAVPPGHFGVTVRCAGDVLREGPTSLDVGQADINDVSWKVDAGIRMAIDVVDEANRSVPGQPFFLLLPKQAGDRSAGIPIEADLTGRYELPAMLESGVYSIEPREGYEGARVSVDLHDGMAEARATLRLAGSGAIVVNVKTRAGRSVDDITVEGSAVDAESGVGPREAVFAVPLGDGRFRLGPLKSGTYSVQVADGVNPITHVLGPAGESIDVSNGVSVETRVELDRSAHIDGRIVDASGQPARAAWVSANCRDGGVAASPRRARDSVRTSLRAGRKRVISDDRGRFHIADLDPSALCTVRADQPSGTSLIKHDVRPGDDVVLAMPALGALRGTAAGADGRPIKAFTITVKELETHRVRSENVPCDDGRWTLAGVLPGKLDVFAKDAEGEAARQNVVLASGQTLDDVRLEFRTPRDRPLARAGSPADP